jgi:hypothetical protein
VILALRCPQIRARALLSALESRIDGVTHVDHLLEGFFRLLLLIFAIGWAGCMLAIPLAALGFFSVLFERNKDESFHPNESE